MGDVTVPYSASSAALVRHRMADDLRRVLPADVVDAAALVVSELVGNAVRHGRALPDGTLQARWDVAGRELHIEVVDGGAGPGPSLPAPAAPEAEGGRGLELIGLLAERWGSRPAPAGTAVWAELPSTAWPYDRALEAGPVLGAGALRGPRPS